MTEKHQLPIDGVEPALADWPTLIERAVDDVSRILRSEVHMLQTSIGTTLQAQISNTLAHLMIVALMISGAICILGAAILLLHQWLPWWQAFGIAGLAMLIVGIVGNSALKPHPLLES
jgi:hypothetical protein